MALFQLDPQSIAARASGAAPRLPTLRASVLRGALGFTLVSIAGFAPWPISDRWFPEIGELGLYVACAAVFIGLSGVCLHRLIIGRGSLWRFYLLFLPAFTAYAIAWVLVWKWLYGAAGSIGGLLAGTTAMGVILAFAFEAPRAALKIILALFVLNMLGYSAGEWIVGKWAIHHHPVGMLLWGACYGLGFGAGLGVAFHLCQERARAAVRGSDSPPRTQFV